MRQCSLSLNKRLAAFAILLGLIALIIGNPIKDTKATVDIKDLALTIDKKTNSISPETLADWLIQGKADFRLIDLRDEKDFNEYHIPSAENIQVTDLNNSLLQRPEKIILYCKRDRISSQAWFLLKAKDFKSVYILDGGIENWNDKILFPKIPENPTPEQLAHYEKIKEVCKFFGGTPLPGGDSAIVPKSKIAPPPIQAPAQINLKRGKPKKEGC